MPWLWLTLAGLREVVWAIGLKYIGTGYAVYGPFRRTEDPSSHRFNLLIVAGIAGLKLVTPS
ncbi:MAG TPA: hypothetical protein VNP36_05215 [Burkholderiales bacterium]|nr:hypothetical protein [Burkholderiales bacterium]